jgi:RNA polymerase sigma-70 factor, ECF subfamily
MPDMSPRDPKAPRRPLPVAEEGASDDLDRLLVLVARGDERAFEAVYDRLAGPAYGVARRVVRDPAQSEEVAQEALLEVWRTAARFDPAMGSAATWVMTIVHRRAIDRLRSMAATLEREQKTASAWAAADAAADAVGDAVEASLNRERVRRCLDGLTEVQHESITLAYYGGYSYREVAALLETAVGTIKTRIRDGLIRLRDCLGVG